MALLLVAVSSAALDLSADQSRRAAAPATSVDRVRAGIQKPGAIDIAVTRPLTDQLPVATFRTGVEQRKYMRTFEERLADEFALTALQRQSWEWGSKCCGIGLDGLFEPIKGALRERKERRIREQIQRELEALGQAADRR
jgi:hypothetical protein